MSMTSMPTPEIWFLTGSQDLYGEDTLRQVAEQSREIVRVLGEAGLPVEVDHFVNSGVLDDPRLAFLGDVFASPAWLPLRNVYSPGDLLLLAGCSADDEVVFALVPARERPGVSASAPLALAAMAATSTVVLELDGLLVDDADVTPEWVSRVVAPLALDGPRLSAMAAAAAAVGERGGDELLADLVAAASAASVASAGGR